jgi:hypothetical protein
MCVVLFQFGWWGGGGGGGAGPQFYSDCQLRDIRGKIGVQSIQLETGTCPRIRHKARMYCSFLKPEGSEDNIKIIYKYSGLRWNALVSGFCGVVMNNGIYFLAIKLYIYHLLHSLYLLVYLY